MRAVDIIEAKKQGKALTEEEIRFLIRGYTDGEIAEICVDNGDVVEFSQPLFRIM